MRLLDRMMESLLSKRRIRGLLQEARAGYDSLRHCWRYGRRYFRPRFRIGPRILEKRFPASPDADLELHMLLCGRDFLMGVWALASWLAHSKLPTRVVVHDDGSLREQQVRRLLAVFPGAVCIRREEADARAQSELAGFPQCLNFRRMSPMGLKLLDFRLFANRSTALMMDSDVFFLDKPAEILDYATPGGGGAAFVFMADIVRSYSLPLSVIAQEGGAVPPGICAGLGLAAVRLIDFAYLEDLFGRRPEIFSEPFLAEQTAYAILGSRNGLQLLGAGYRIPSERDTYPLIAGHYVRGIRERFWIDGVGTGHRAILEA